MEGDPTGTGLAVLVVSAGAAEPLERTLAAVAKHLPGARVLAWCQPVGAGDDGAGDDRAGLAAARPEVDWTFAEADAGRVAARNALAARADAGSRVPRVDLLLLEPGDRAPRPAHGGARGAGTSRGGGRRGRPGTGPGRSAPVGRRRAPDPGAGARPRDPRRCRGPPAGARRAAARGPARRRRGGRCARRRLPARVRRRPGRARGVRRGLLRPRRGPRLAAHGARRGLDAVAGRASPATPSGRSGCPRADARAGAAGPDAARREAELDRAARVILLGNAGHRGAGHRLRRGVDAPRPRHAGRAGAAPQADHRRRRPRRGTPRRRHHLEQPRPRRRRAAAHPAGERARRPRPPGDGGVPQGAGPLRHRARPAGPPEPAAVLAAGGGRRRPARGRGRRGRRRHEHRDGLRARVAGAGPRAGAAASWLPATHDPAELDRPTYSPTQARALRAAGRPRRALAAAPRRPDPPPAADRPRRGRPERHPRAGAAAVARGRRADPLRDAHADQGLQEPAAARRGARRPRRRGG